MPITLQIVLLFTLWARNIVEEVTVEHTFYAAPNNLFYNLDEFLLSVSNAAKAKLTAQPCVKLTAELSVGEIGEGLSYELPVAAEDIDDALNDKIRPVLIYYLATSGVLKKK